MGDMRVSPEDVKRSAPGLGDVADALHDAYATLCDELTADHGCWGADAYGSAFLHQYTPVSHGAEKTTRQVVDALHDMERTLTSSADNYARTERINTDGFTRGV